MIRAEGIKAIHPALALFGTSVYDKNNRAS